MGRRQVADKERNDEIARAVALALKGFGVRVREARQKAGLTQHQLATRIRSSHTYMFELETGIQNVSLGTMAKVAYACGVEIRDLLPETGGSAPATTSIELLCSVLKKVDEAFTDFKEQEARRQAVEAVLAERLRGFSDMRAALESLLPPAPSAPPPPPPPPPPKKRRGRPPVRKPEPG